MAETDIKAKCYDCKHFVDEGAHLGICKRFPKAENKHKNDWCGEYVFKKTIADITREALEVMEGNINLKAIEEGIERRKAQFEAMFAEEEKPKKRGRKPKNATTSA